MSVEEKAAICGVTSHTGGRPSHLSPLPGAPDCGTVPRTSGSGWEPEGAGRASELRSPGFLQGQQGCPAGGWRRPGCDLLEAGAAGPFRVSQRAAAPTLRSQFPEGGTSKGNGNLGRVPSTHVHLLALELEIHLLEGQMQSPPVTVYYLLCT